MTNSRPAHPLCGRSWLHPYRAAADLRASARRLLGLSADRAFRADAAPRRSRRLSRASSIARMRRASASFSTGFRRISRPTSMGSRNSTAGRSMNMPIRAVVSIPTGTPRSMISAAARSANFLIANALYWLDRFHIDGLRVDAVASMLYLDYSRKPGEWSPNSDGSNDNRDAVAFLQRFNELVYALYPGVVTIAEESTAWAGVSRPTYAGGLGFGFKWNMGWMNDTLRYMSHDPVHRKWHHDKLTFGLLYAFSENFVLPLSHDEVVHGKGSLLDKMPGDEWQKLRECSRLLRLHVGASRQEAFVHGPGVRPDGANGIRDAGSTAVCSTLPPHRGLQRLVRDLNRFYRGHEALYARDCEPEGFRWIVVDDAESSVVAFVRFGADRIPPIVVVANFTPVPRHAYRIGLPRAGWWREISIPTRRSMAAPGLGNLGAIQRAPRAFRGFPAQRDILLPPLATLYFQFADQCVRMRIREFRRTQWLRGSWREIRMRSSAPIGRQAMAFVLAGGRGSRLLELTDRRAKPAVYFGGKSRIIDFALSNALNSGIRRIGVATQYKAHSLIGHLQRGWNFFRTERNESFDILPASQRVSENQWYAGTADAVYQNIDIIESYDPKYMVVLAGDHIYKMDYELMLQQHVDSGADVTVGCLEVPRDEASGFGVMHVDENDRIIVLRRKARAIRRRCRDIRTIALPQHGHLCLRNEVSVRPTAPRRRRRRTRARISARTSFPTLSSTGRRSRIISSAPACARRMSRSLLARRRHRRCLLGGQYRSDRFRAASRSLRSRLADLDRCRDHPAGEIRARSRSVAADRRCPRSSPAAASFPARRCGARCCLPACA